ncbi:MAG: FAD-dependent monooxygenase [Nonomuraea sp.]|nr:FAD-dependent monooxygenase [Nonomuraea sp.]
MSPSIRLAHMKALIIGGGIAGPVTATALRRAGIDAVVYEAHPSAAYEVGAGLTVAPNGQNALGIIGADEAVRALGQPVPGSIFCTAGGYRLADFRGLPGLPASVVLPRADLFRALAEHALAMGVPIEYGKRLVAVDERPDGITARFDDGSSAEGDVLIGADGIRSTVRTLIDEAAPGPQYGGILSFGAPSPAAGIDVEPGSMYFAFGSGFLGYWLLPDGERIMWFGSLPHPEPLTSAEARAVAPEVWLERLAELYGQDQPAATLIATAKPEDLFVTGPMEMMPPLPYWHRGRMVLVGDSAHAPSTSSGQGASQAIESSVELARCLRDLPDHEQAFAAYERLRRPRVEAIAAAAAGTNKKKAGDSAGPPAFPTEEQMFGSVHRHVIEWDVSATSLIS